MKRFSFFVLSGVLVLVLGRTDVWAQATAQISGTARDQSGAVLPGVEITATQTDTGISRNTVSNENGSYVMPNLALGPYRLEAVLPGFRTYAQTGIVLQVNSNPVINVTLEVGQVSEHVDVQANAALVETRSSTVGSVVENQRILELPLNGRNVTDLITLAGGAVQQGTTSQNFYAGQPVLAVAGSAGWGTDYTLDGSDHLNFVSGTSMIMPFPDATQEFKVENGGVTAQRGTPTAVAAVTKSGTNTFHGDLFEYVRNDLFNATQYFAAIDKGTGRKARSTLKRNQFGGTLGGPIVANKLFFFGGYQGTTQRQDPANTETFIPTPAILAGDWTTFASPACNGGRQVTLRAPFVNNRIDPSLYSKPAMFLLNWKGNLPFPSTSDPCGRLTYGTPTANNLGLVVGKIDYQKSVKHSLFARVLIAPDNILNPKGSNTNLLQDTGWRNSLASSYTLGSTYLVSPDTIQGFRLAVNRTAVHFKNVGPGYLFTWCNAGVNIYCAPETTRVQSLSISGAFGVNSGFLDGHKYVATTYSMNDDVSTVRGSHQIAFGVTARYGTDYSFSNWASTTQFNFNGGATGAGLSDFLLGRPGSVLLARSNPHHVKGTTIGMYITDTWKATPKLTLNYGLRWDPYIPQEAEALYNFDYKRFQQGVKSTLFLNAPAGLYFRGDPGFPKDGVNPNWLQFGPRVGLGWDVTGDGRTSVRASYSLGYVYVPGDFRETYSGTGPWGNRVTLSSPVGGLQDPWLGVPGGNMFPYVLDKNAPFAPYAWIYTQPYNLRAPYSNAWNLSIQRQIGNDWLVSTTYMGSNMIHVWTNKSLNPAIYIPGGPCTLNGVTYNPCSTLGNTDARRRFSIERPDDGAKMGYVAEADDGATQTYHGMLLSVQRRAARGVTVSANYTLSHCVGDYATLYNPMAMHPYNTYTDPYNRRADRGNCESDRRQIFNVTTVAETPKFSNPILRVVAASWKISGIYRLSSGDPLNILAGSASSDSALNGVQNQRGNQLLANPYGDQSARPLSTYINPLAFAVPAAATMGNIGHNSLVGPRTWSFDVGLSRIFRIREMQQLEFRVEAFNVLNSFRPKDPGTSVNTSTFGQIRSAYDPRIMQFALKYVF